LPAGYTLNTFYIENGLEAGTVSNMIADILLSEHQEQLALGILVAIAIVFLLSRWFASIDLWIGRRRL
jgi:hypothetical protein